MIATVLWSLTLPVGNFDDGIQLTGAMLYRQGKIPNVDFYSVYPPLNYYIIAVAFRLLGESVVAYRIVQTFAYVVTVSAIGLFAFQRCRGSAIKWVFVVVLLLSLQLAELQSASALMWSILALVSFLEAEEKVGRARSYRLLFCGLCIGAVAMTRLNFALYFGVAWFVNAATAIAVVRTRQMRQTVVRDFVWTVLPALAVTIAILCVWGAPVPALVRQIVTVPSRANAAWVLMPVPTHLSRPALALFAESGVLAVGLPPAWLAARAAQEGDVASSRRLWASTIALVFVSLCVSMWRPAVLPALAAILIVVLVVARLRWRWLQSDEWFVWLVLAAQEHYMLGRPDGPHFLALFPTIAVAVTIAVGRRADWASMRVPASVLFVCGPAILMSVMSLARGLRARLPAIAAIDTLMRSNDEALYGSCGACDRLWPDRNELAAASFIRRRSQPDDRVFSGVQDDGRLVVNDIRAYWLMKRPVGTRSIMMVRHVTSGPKQEGEIVQDLESRGARWLLLWKGVPDAATVAEDQAEGSVLDRFIRRGFTRDACFGDYEVWHVKGP